MTTPDTYTEATMRALGRNIAEIFTGMVEGGMSRREALQAVIAYLRALAERNKDQA